MRYVAYVTARDYDYIDIEAESIEEAEEAALRELQVNRRTMGHHSRMDWELEYIEEVQDQPPVNDNN